MRASVRSAANCCSIASPTAAGSRRAIDDADRRGRPPGTRRDRRLSDGTPVSERIDDRGGCRVVLAVRKEDETARKRRRTPRLGATGAIYAMRRSLWTPLPPDTILDDVLAPMRCVLAGYRVVFNERARAFDRTAPDAHAEAQRKIRTLAGNFQVLSLEPGLLLPWRNVVWLQYWSHKVGRLLVPYALIALMATSIALAERSMVYATALVGPVRLLSAGGVWRVAGLQGTGPAGTPVEESFMGEPGAPRRDCARGTRRPHCLHVSDDELFRGGRAGRLPPG